MILSDIIGNDYSRVHFIGIGGISMSGLAEILLTEGYTVSGSDMKNSPIINRLKNKGAEIHISHDKDNLGNVDLVVYTDAISDDNPELIEALRRGIPTMDRGSFLGELMKRYKNSIAVSGTHGKTTTTGMISIILDKSTLEPTILLGGELDQIGGNVKIGKDSYLLTEACEYKGNILKFHPTIGIILNVEEDHLDYFKDLSHIVETFESFAKSIPPTGTLIINGDDVNTLEIIKNTKCENITFGIKNRDCKYFATNIEFNNFGLPKYSLIVDDKSYEITLSVMGIHNIYNSLAAIATTHKCGVPMETIINSIKLYTGTHRRLEHKGSYNDIKVIDDYAHHPTEVKATLDSIEKIANNKVWCVFQPHTYTRTKALLDEFSHSFAKADMVIISDIYAAREKDTGLIHSKDLVEKLKENDVDAIYIRDFKDISEYLLNSASYGDIILTMGAGDIYRVGEILLKKKNSYIS